MHELDSAYCKGAFHSTKNSGDESFRTKFFKGKIPEVFGMSRKFLVLKEECNLLLGSRHFEWPLKHLYRCNFKNNYLKQWVSFVNNNPTSAQKLKSFILGCMWFRWKWIATRKKKVAGFFKFLLCIWEKWLKNDHSLLFLLG